MGIETIVFFILAIFAVGSAIIIITRKNPVTAASFLIIHFFSLASLYLTLQAQLLAVLQMLVYAGAIMVLVVFVIMLLNLGDEERLNEKVRPQQIVGIVLSFVLVLQMVFAFYSHSNADITQLASNAMEIGSTEGIGMVLFTDFIFPFEAVSLLLLAAIVGSIMLAKRKLSS